LASNDAGIHHLGGYLRNGLDVQFEDEDWPEPNGREQRHEARGSMGSIVLLGLTGGVALVCTDNLNAGVAVMKSAQDGA